MEGNLRRVKQACLATGREKDDLMRRSTNCQRCTLALLETKEARESERVAHAAAFGQPQTGTVAYVQPQAGATAWSATQNLAWATQ